MAIRPQDLTIAKNPHASETIGAKMLDMLATVTPVNALDASAIRMARKHALELFEIAGVEGAELAELKKAAGMNVHTDATPNVHEG